jgi:hypothetical protein
VVAKMMAKDPRRRFQTPGEVAQALTPFFKKGSVAVTGVNPDISPGGDKPVVITVAAGKHKIVVKKDGLEIAGHEVTVQAESKNKFTVRFVAPNKLPHELSKDDGPKSITNSIEWVTGQPTDRYPVENVS